MTPVSSVSAAPVLPPRSEVFRPERPPEKTAIPPLPSPSPAETKAVETPKPKEALREKPAAYDSAAPVPDRTAFGADGPAAREAYGADGPAARKAYGADGPAARKAYGADGPAAAEPEEASPLEKAERKYDPEPIAPLAKLTGQSGPRSALDVLV